MRQHRSDIRLLGVIIMIFASAHLLLNLYIIAAYFMLGLEQSQELIQKLSGIFGPIAIREDMNMAMLFVKVAVSALFLSSAVGMIRFREWSRKLLFCLLGMRIAYGAVICYTYNILHPHLFIMILTGVFLFYYLTRRNIKREFAL